MKNLKNEKFDEATVEKRTKPGQILYCIYERDISGATRCTIHHHDYNIDNNDQGSRSMAYFVNTWKITKVRLVSAA